jgi:hypothetical protein
LVLSSLKPPPVNGLSVAWLLAMPVTGLVPKSRPNAAAEALPP